MLFKNINSGTHPRDSDIVVLIGVPMLVFFKSSLGDSNMQPGLRTTDLVLL